MFLQHQKGFALFSLLGSFDPELCICIYVAYQPAFGWPPLPIFNLLPEKMLFAFDVVKTRVGHSVSGYAVSFGYAPMRYGPVLMSADDGTGPPEVLTLLSRHWYEIMTLYYVKSVLTEISASRQDKRVLQKSKIIRSNF